MGGPYQSYIQSCWITEGQPTCQLNCLEFIPAPRQRSWQAAWERKEKTAAAVSVVRIPSDTTLLKCKMTKWLRSRTPVRWCLLWVFYQDLTPPPKEQNIVDQWYLVIWWSMGFYHPVSEVITIRELRLPSSFKGKLICRTQLSDVHSQCTVQLLFSILIWLVYYLYYIYIFIYLFIYLFIVLLMC